MAQPFILLYSEVSQLFLVLFLVIILSLQIRRRVSLSLFPFLWRLSSQLRVIILNLFSIMGNPFRAIRCFYELFLFLVPPKAIILEDSSFSAFRFHPQFFSIVVSSFVSRLSGALFKSSLTRLLISSFSYMSIHSCYPHSFQFLSVSPSSLLQVCAHISLKNLFMKNKWYDKYIACHQFNFDER